MIETRAWTAVALGAAALLPLAAACSANSNTPSNTPSNPPNAPPPAGSAGYGGAPPGYPGTYAAQQPGYGAAQPGSPAGYPTTQPPPGYSYPQQPSAPPAQTAAPAGTYGAPATAYPQQPATSGGYPAPSASAAPPGTPAPAGPLAPTDPNSLQQILAGLQGALQGTLVAPGSMPADITEAGLKAQALRLAPGMQPEGDELKQTLSEGQHAVMMVTLQAGRCYTIVGFSPPGSVKDLDLNLLAPPFYVTLAGQDLSHDNMPAVGGARSPMCPVIAFPLQYKLDVFARSGSGPVAVQLYSKPKS